MAGRNARKVHRGDARLYLDEKHNNTVATKDLRFVLSRL